MRYDPLFPVRPDCVRRVLSMRCAVRYSVCNHSGSWSYWSSHGAGEAPINTDGIASLESTAALPLVSAIMYSRASVFSVAMRDIRALDLNFNS